MKITFAFIIFFSNLLYGFSECPTQNDTNRYITTPLRSESSYDKDTIQIFYKLVRPYDPAKVTLLVINGGPGGNHGIIEAFRYTKLAEEFNIVGFDHRGLGCTHILSTIEVYNEVGLYGMARASDDIEAIRKDLLGEDGKWFVYGISYGTFLGQRYAIKYPEHISGMILDSAFYDSSFIGTARQQFAQLFIDDNLEIKNQFSKLLEKYPSSKNSVLRALISNTYNFYGRTVLVPQFLAAVSNADTLNEANNILDRYIKYGTPMVGMTRQIACEEIWDYAVADPRESYFMWYFDEECAAYKKYSNPMAFGESLKKLPMRVFIWGGKYDPVTPIQGMRQMRELIPQSLLWENPKAGHGLIGENTDCAINLASQFMKNTSDSELEDLATSVECQTASNSRTHFMKFRPFIGPVF